MNSNASREERAREWAAKHPPSADAVGAASVALMEAAAVFQFLADTFTALDVGQVDLKLSFVAAGGLANICRSQASALLDAYGAL